jgi:Fur family ferric uptake transcriptional regulator
MDKSEIKNKFRTCLVERGLKATRQREIILEEFLRAGSHLSIEELHLRVRKKNPRIGYATVYRTLKLFTDCGIAEQRQFGDGHTRYESTSVDEHHDHLICINCGVIIEFEEPEIEELQLKVAGEHGFTIERHRLNLYGRCRNCQKA